MITVGLSGNRYSGKKTVCTLFEKIGIPVFDADTVLKFILNYNQDVLSDIRKVLGNDAFYGHSLDFRHLNKKQFESILSIVEADIFKAYTRFNKVHEAKGAIYTIFKSSVLFEYEWDKKVDLSINVFSPDTDRMKRCKYKTNMGLLIIRDKMKEEMESLEKSNLADYIIKNNNEDSIGFDSKSPSANLLKQVNEIDQEIINEYIYKESLNAVV